MPAVIDLDPGDLVMLEAGLVRARGLVAQLEQQKAELDEPFPLAGDAEQRAEGRRAMIKAMASARGMVASVADAARGMNSADA